MLARSGGEPLADKRRLESVPTFSGTSATVVERKRAGWRGRRQPQAWLNSLERYAFPRIGSRPVSEVDSADVLEVLTPIWHSKIQTALAVRQRIRAVMEWAIAMNLRADNPCGLSCASADGSNPAISGHRKPGHFRRPETGVE